MSLKSLKKTNKDIAYSHFRCKGIFSLEMYDLPDKD